MDLNLLDFNPQRALDYANQISYPRLVGTEEEKTAGKQVAAWLEGFGYNVERQDFHFSNALNVFIAGEILLCQLFVLLILALQALDSPISSVGALLLIMLVALITPINRMVQIGALEPEAGQRSSLLARLCWRTGKRYHTCNLVASLADSPDNLERNKLLLVAHYDSKSQRIRLTTRISLFVIGLGGTLVFAGLILFSSLFPALETLALVIGGLAVLAGLPLLFLDLGNASPGAIDNASGVGVVLHLAELLAKHPEAHQKLDISVLITSAEELGTLGAVAFVRKYEEQLRCQANAGRLYILNFDGPGVDGPLYWVGKDPREATPLRPSLHTLVREACGDLGYPLGKFNLPGALFDHQPFSDFGFDSGSLIAISRASLSVHTPEDAVAQLHPRGFDQAVRVALKVIAQLLALPQPETLPLDCGLSKSGLYRSDPVLRLLRDRLRLTPLSALLIALALGGIDLLIAHSYDLWFSRDGIIGALQDPPYLLTMFVIIPLFLRTYVWMPDGMWGIFHGLPNNRLVRRRDLPTYQLNVNAVVNRFNHTWFLITVLIAVLLEIAVLVGNYFYGVTYGDLFTARLVLFRIPYGVLALYAASAVVIRLILSGDWSRLFQDIEPQIHPLHPDKAAGYGGFTQVIVNLLGIFVAIATFFFTKALFKPSDTEVTFQPEYNLWIIISTVLYLIIGFVVFLYLPTGAARRAIGQAKRRQMNTIAERYNEEQREFLRMMRQAQADGIDAVDNQEMKTQIERLKLLNEAMNMVENVPSSPINNYTIRRFGLSYISIYLTTVIYNFLRAFASDATMIEFTELLDSGSFLDILRGMISIIFTGQL